MSVNCFYYCYVGLIFFLKNLKQNLCLQNKEGKNARSTSLYINSLPPVKCSLQGKLATWSYMTTDSIVLALWCPRRAHSPSLSETLMISVQFPTPQNYFCEMLQEKETQGNAKASALSLHSHPLWVLPWDSASSQLGMCLAGQSSPWLPTPSGQVILWVENPQFKLVMCRCLDSQSQIGTGVFIFPLVCCWCVKIEGREKLLIRADS